MKNTIKWLIVALAWTGMMHMVQATPVTPESFNRGFNSGYYTAGAGSWSVAARGLIAGIYLGDTSGSVMNAGSYNSTLTFVNFFDDNHEDAFGGPYGDPDFDMILAGGRYSPALSDDNAAGTDEFRTSTLSAIPVPAAAWLFGTALLAFFGVSRRKTRA